MYNKSFVCSLPNLQNSWLKLYIIVFELCEICDCRCTGFVFPTYYLMILVFFDFNLFKAAKFSSTVITRFGFRSTKIHMISFKFYFHIMIFKCNYIILSCIHIFLKLILWFLYMSLNVVLIPMYVFVVFFVFIRAF